MEQEGSGVVLGPVVSTTDAPAQRATVRNITNQTITGLRFVVVVERLAFRTPVRLFVSELLPVSIAPGESADVSPNALSSGQLEEVAAEASSPVQLFVGLQEVRFANGAGWAITPNPAAANHREALALGRPEIPRELVEVATSATAEPNGLCRDQNGRGYSPGALVPVRNEPGRKARCDGGQWRLEGQ